MKTTGKRAVSFMLHLVMTGLICLSAASCSSNTPESADKQVTDLPSEQSTTEDPADARLYPDLPERTFDGYEFTFLTRYINNVDWKGWDPQDIYAESENGDVINDAVYKRNRTVEEKYDIKIKELRKETSTTEFDIALKGTILSGENAFDAVCPHPFLNKNYILSGFYTNLLEIPYLDLSKPWWDVRSVDELTIDNKLFCVFGDLLTMHKQGTAAVIFNKDVFTDYNLEYPYKSVLDGTWTFDKMMEYMKGFGADLNNDQVMDMNDRYGFVCFVDSMTSFYNGAGEKFAVKDENGLPVCAFGSQRTYDVTEKLFDLMYDTSNAINGHAYEGKLPIYDTTNNMFMKGDAMFMWIKMNVVAQLRSYEGNFGILPTPKYDAQQSRYYSTVNNHVSSYICVPVTAPDLERTGIILEALCAESKYTLQPAYYDVALTTKYARDEESKEMLDIIFDSTTYDIGLYYDFGGFSTAYYELSRKNNRNIVSTFEKSQGKIEKDIAKFIEEFSKIV